jgi:hypothetical protein
MESAIQDDIATSCTFSQNSGELPNRRYNLSAIMGLIACRSLNNSFIVWGDSPKAFAMEAVFGS